MVAITLILIFAFVLTLNSISAKTSKNNYFWKESNTALFVQPGTQEYKVQQLDKVGSFQFNNYFSSSLPSYEGLK